MSQAIPSDIPAKVKRTPQPPLIDRYPRLADLMDDGPVDAETLDATLFIPAGIVSIAAAAGLGLILYLGR